MDACRFCLLIFLSMVPRIVAWDCMSAGSREVCERLQECEAVSPTEASAQNCSIGVVFVGQIGQNLVLGQNCEFMGEGSKIGGGIAVAVFSIVFFSIWNLVCSDKVVTLILHVYQEGFSSSSFVQLALPLMMGLIGILVPAVMWGVFGIATMVFPTYAFTIYREMKGSKPAGTTSDASFPGAVEPVDGVQTLDNVDRFAYEPPQVSDDAESKPNTAPAQTASGYLDERSPSRQPWEPQCCALGCFYELRLPEHETRVIDGFMLKAFQDRKLICVKIEKRDGRGSWTACNDGQVYFPSWVRGADGIEGGTAIQKVDALGACTALRIYPVVWTGGVHGKIAITAALRVKAPPSTVVIDP